MPSLPRLWIDSCTSAHRRLEDIVRGLTDAQARRPSLLPDWTVGHILTHLARNADANSGMVEGALHGQSVPMYPGGAAQREADIASGQGRPAEALTADLSTAIRRLEQAWAALDEDAWATGTSRTFGGVRSIAFTVFMRWREVEAHTADLGLTELGGPSWDKLSTEYIDAEWQEQIAGLARRVPDGEAVMLVPGDRPSRVFGSGAQPVVVRDRPARIVQWLMGRGGQPGWPALGPWS